MIQWFKKHPQYLARESKLLSTDSNYKQLHQARGRFFLSQGEILVRLSDTSRHPVLIIYPEASPYQLPMVFPLNRILPVTEVEALAQLDLAEMFKQLAPDIRFYYELRHQNSSGELCVLERENLEQDNNFYSITAILRRLRDWFAAHQTGEFPPDSEEVEFHAHFNDVHPSMKLIYGLPFLNRELVEGTCFAVLHSVIQSNDYLRQERRTYIGRYIDGIKQSGLYEETYIDLQERFGDDRITDSVDIQTKKGIIQQLVERGQAIRAEWFQVEQEPTPFRSLPELVAIIGNCDYENGIERIAKHDINMLSSVDDTFYLAIRFPNRKGDLEFQLFKIHKNTEQQGYLITHDPKEKLKHLLELYNRVELVKCEKVTPESFHQRNSTRADYSILSTKELNLFGVGAIGSEMADAFAKAGIGDISLFDSEGLNVHNSIRHLAGTDMSEQYKVDAVAEIIHAHNPFVRLYRYPLNLFYHPFTEYTTTESITVSSIADDYVEGFINQEMVIAGRTVFYVRALRGATAARIIRVIPGTDACLNCLKLYKQEGRQFVSIPADSRYPTLKNECNNPIRAASAADLKLIAALGSRLVIDHFQSPHRETNHYVWASEPIEGTPLTSPYQLHQLAIEPHPKCQYCHHDKRLAVSLPDICLTMMQTLIAENPAIETGGVMAGYRDEKGPIIITDVSGPGPRASRSSGEFKKDTAFCQQFLDDLYRESGDKKRYVGEWHSHPSANNKPSGKDIKSLSEIALQDNYLTEEPVMIILSNKGYPSCTVHPAGKTYYFPELSVNPEVPGNDPLI